MYKIFAIILIVLLSFNGCSDPVKDESTTPQLWRGVYEHIGTEIHTIYILSYNVVDKPPILQMETVHANNISKVSIRELSIVSRSGNSVTLAPSDVYTTDKYNPQRDAIVFTIHNELQAEITSVDKKFIVSMNSVKNGESK